MNLGAPTWRFPKKAVRGVAVVAGASLHHAPKELVGKQVFEAQLCAFLGCIFTDVRILYL